LFKGKLYVTLDGNYAVQGAQMTVDDDINLNFVRNLDIELAFEKTKDDKYYLSKSSLGIAFALTNKGKGIKGKRVQLIEEYQNGVVRPDSIYQVPDQYVVDPPTQERRSDEHTSELQ